MFWRRLCLAFLRYLCRSHPFRLFELHAFCYSARVAQRIILLVLNGVGLGALPDSQETGEGGVNSLGRMFDAFPDLALPHFEALGLGHVAAYPNLRKMDQPEGCFGRLIKQSPGSDALTAAWELAGLPQAEAVPSFRGGVPEAILQTAEQLAKRPIVTAKTNGLDHMLAMSGTQAYREKGLFVWGDEGGACHLAAHETVVPMKDLFRLAREIRTSGPGSSVLWQVGARSYGGPVGAFRWLDGWRESSVPVPNKSLFDHLIAAEQLVTSFGKSGDMFNGSGFTRSIPVRETAVAWSDLLKTLGTTPRGLILVNLFDDLDQVAQSQYTEMFAEQLKGLDARLPDLQKKLKPEDIVCVTADQGRVPDRRGFPVREYAPLLVFGPRLARGVNLGDRPTYADVGQTIAEAFEAARLSVGESFLHALQRG